MIRGGRFYLVLSAQRRKGYLEVWSHRTNQTDLLKKHFNPKLSPIVQRCKFYSCERTDGQSVASYVAELRKLSEYCEFGENLQDMLRERLVVGINNENIQKRLLSVEYSKITFNKALEIATLLEQANTSAKVLQQNSVETASDVNRVETSQRKPNNNRSRKKVCYRCGGKHDHTVCRFKDSECYACGKSGHIASVCKSKPPKTSVNQVSKQNVCPHEESYSLFSIGNHISAYKVDLFIDNKIVTMEIDRCFC